MYRDHTKLTRYEVVARNSRQTALLAVDSAAIRPGNAGAGLQLESHDVFIVKKTPLWDEASGIVKAGDVCFPTKYPIH